MVSPPCYAVFLYIFFFFVPLLSYQPFSSSPLLPDIKQDPYRRCDQNRNSPPPFSAFLRVSSLIGLHFLTPRFCGVFPLPPRKFLPAPPPPHRSLRLKVSVPLLRTANHSSYLVSQAAPLIFPHSFLAGFLRSCTLSFCR